MGIREDYKPFADEYGLIHSSPVAEGISQNGPRWTAEYFFALKRAKELNTQDNIHIAAAYDFCEKLPGVLSRHPTSDEQEGPDDVFAYLAVSRHMGGAFARDFLEHGRIMPIFGYDEAYTRKKWYSKILMWLVDKSGYHYVYNNKDVGLFNESAWLGRQLPLIAHAKLCAGEKINWFWELCWCIGVLGGASNKEYQDGKVLTWFMVKGSERRRTWIMSKVCKYWTYKLKKHYEGGIGGVLKSYFTFKGHPSTKWLWNEFGE